VVRADLAGIDPNEIELKIRGRELTLSGQRRPQHGEERVYQQIEIEHGPFRRVVALGVDVDSGAAQASYEDGILTVELPLAETEPARTVPIQRSEEP
jgi:HSP20 family protein